MDEQFELYYSHTPVSHIYIKWGLTIKENEFRQGMNDLIDLMRENETGKILSNNVNMKELSDAEQKWSIEDWLPRALAVGYSAIAIIVSKNLFGKMAIEDILNNASELSPIRIQYFEDEERAKLWLISL